MNRLLRWLLAPLSQDRDAPPPELGGMSIDELLDEIDYREAWLDYIAGCA